MLSLRRYVFCPTFHGTVIFVCLLLFVFVYFVFFIVCVCLLLFFEREGVGRESRNQVYKNPENKSHGISQNTVTIQ